MITFTVIVDTKAALLAGKTVTGDVALTWDDAEVGKLSVPQREELVNALTELLGTRMDDLPLADASFESVVAGLQHRVVARAARQAEDRREAEAAAAAAARAAEEEQARKRDEAEKEAKRRLALQKWVDKNGDDNQKARNKEGLLPEREILEAVRDRLFEELEDYEVLKRPGPAEACSCACAGEVKTELQYPTGMTAEQYNLLVDIRKDAPKDAKVQPFVAEVRCHGGCDCKPVTALGVAVQTLWNGFIITREFAL